jgi:hypothetical protein
MIDDDNRLRGMGTSNAPANYPLVVIERKATAYYIL